MAPVEIAALTVIGSLVPEQLCQRTGHFVWVITLGTFPRQTISQLYLI